MFVSIGNGGIAALLLSTLFFAAVANRIGEQRWSGLIRILAAIVYLGFVSVVTGTIAFGLAILWATLDFLKILIYNERLEWGQSWPKAILVWNYDMVLWIFGFCEFPGWYPTPRHHA